MVIGVSGVGGWVPVVFGPGDWLWIGPSRCCVLHHFLGFVADSFGVFCLAASGPSEVACVSWWCRPFRCYGALKA